MSDIKVYPQFTDNIYIKDKIMNEIYNYLTFALKLLIYVLFIRK